MTSATDILRDEHVLILQALALLEAAADRLEAGGAVGSEWWAALMGWFQSFADRNHHAKEERCLFPAMVEAGVPGEGGGPIAVMLAEHADGRALVRTMAEGEPAARGPAARGYIELLRAHIDKENGILFPLGEAVLDETSQRVLARDFEALADALGREASATYAEAVLHGLAAALEGSTRPIAL